ncbi:MAG: deoxyribonuclease IV [Thermoplasmata archaeon]|nr:deoxyribonuclease IV [Thermoplasmata archaeon]
MILGAHIGIADGLAEAPVVGRKIGCEAIQIFSKSPQMWGGPPLAEASAKAFAEAVRHEGLRTTAVHHGYLANLASPKPPQLKRSQAAFLDELKRAELLEVDHLILHPGAHMGSGAETGVTTIAESLNAAFDATPGFKVRVLLENAAGQGTAMGTRFEDLADVLRRVVDRQRVGIALDTCHLFAAGFDFRTAIGYGELIDRIEATFGVDQVRAFHLNDAKADVGSHLDRHENIDQGKIGADGFRPWLADPRWADRAGYLETPLGDDDGYAAYEQDLTTLRGLTKPVAAKRARRRTSP